MYLNAILLQLAQHATVTLGVIASLSLCASVTLAVQRLAGPKENGLSGRLQRMESALEQLHGAVAESRVDTPVGFPGLTAATRARALGMLSSGNPPEAVAAATGLACNEVELLLKVRRALAKQPASV